jgi:fatty-acyl-CoA synthase
MISPARSASGMSLQLAWSTLAEGVAFARRSGLLKALSPLTMARFTRDLLVGGQRGVPALLHLHALADPRRPALVSMRLGAHAAPVAAAAGARSHAPSLAITRPSPGRQEIRFNYGEFESRILRIAHGLYRLGVGPGDRVALLLHNGHEHVELGAACTLLGAILVPIGYRLKAPEVAYILRHSGARVLVFQAQFQATVEAALDEIGDGGLVRERCVVAPDETIGATSNVAIGATTAIPAAPGAGLASFVPYDQLLGGAAASRPPAVNADNYGTMIYTSGTTGRPKGAKRVAKESRLEVLVHFMAALPWRHDERHLVVCPLYHAAAQAFTIMTYLVGGCVVVMEHFEPREVLRVIERERISSAFMVPTMYQRLVDLGLEELRRYDLSSLRWLMSGAAPLPTALARRIEQGFGPILYNFYGATETGTVTLARPGEHTARPGTIGRPVAGNELRLIDEAGHPVPEDRVGVVGELYVRNGLLVEGYHADEAATRAAQRDGFMSVGDLAWRDADGYYYLADRKVDMVISGGVNIYPSEIEQRLHEHPAVAEAAVVGVPDPEWGESLVAYVVLRPGRTAGAEELREHVGAMLADYKKPRQVLFVPELPRNPTGKVLKRELRAMYTTHLRAQAEERMQDAEIPSS